MKINFVFNMVVLGMECLLNARDDLNMAVDMLQNPARLIIYL